MRVCVCACLCVCDGWAVLWNWLVLTYFLVLTWVTGCKHWGLQFSLLPGMLRDDFLILQLYCIKNCRIVYEKSKTNKKPPWSWKFCFCRRRPDCFFKHQAVWRHFLLLHLSIVQREKPLADSPCRVQPYKCYTLVYHMLHTNSLHTCCYMFNSVMHVCIHVLMPWEGLSMHA